ncbi:hypothetical protein SAMN02745704_02898 [Paucidesulfovibrio gracilis DSM 16080]|uniref:Uncharacterized protein n=1 Tax=Paucidesulfovibrio gracilis DSM 16080 TaxID=1121449 RepID=A0A1T4Y8D5_9BACT|nr:hypothetical protein [Paucidesulfovibrio gracilis]SKA98104.1 hypothetical protein SAMN02745704_02898 [Paucidesulfovibrio gracilis DSM 16080]
MSLLLGAHMSVSGGLHRPMVLETDKDETLAHDVRNLTLLRGLCLQD